MIVPNALAIALGALGLIGPGVTLMNNGSTVVAALVVLSPVVRR